MKRFKASSILFVLIVVAGIILSTSGVVEARSSQGTVNVRLTVIRPYELNIAEGEEIDLTEGEFGEDYVTKTEFIDEGERIVLYTKVLDE